MKICWRISCVACSRTAPILRSSIASWTRESLSKASWRIHCWFSTLPIVARRRLHPQSSKLPLPVDLYRHKATEQYPRRNSIGVDFGNPEEIQALLQSVRDGRARRATGGPILGGVPVADALTEVRNPAARDEVVGVTRNATDEEIQMAFERAASAFPAWDRLGGGGARRHSRTSRGFDRDASR